MQITQTAQTWARAALVKLYYAEYRNFYRAEKEYCTKHGIKYSRTKAQSIARSKLKAKYFLEYATLYDKAVALGYVRSHHPVREVHDE